MTIVEKDRLQTAEKQLRQIAVELRSIAPAAAMKASGLATEVNLRSKLLEMASDE